MHPIKIVLLAFIVLAWWLAVWHGALAQEFTILRHDYNTGQLEFRRYYLMEDGVWHVLKYQTDSDGVLSEPTESMMRRPCPPLSLQLSETLGDVETR